MAEEPTSGFGERAREKRKTRDESFVGVDYVRFVDDWRDFRRGTIVLGDVVVHGYPGIPRIFRLDSGVLQQFHAPVFAEEKVDGYNVRVFRHGDRILAATRGGLLCPFTTDRLPDFVDPRVFDDHPDLVLCAEVAGPENPYMEGCPPYVTEDVRLYVFDVGRKGEAHFLPHAEKCALVDRYGLPSAEVYGRYRHDEIDRLRALLTRLNRDGHEGVVLKEDGPRDHRAKYVTSDSSIYDIGIGSESLLQLPAEYFTGRLLRLALFLDEEGLPADDDLHRRLGRAFLAGVSSKVRQFHEEGRVYHEYRCRFREEANARLFLDHMHRLLGHVHVVSRRLERVGPHWVLDFEKEFPRMTGLFHHLFGGGCVLD